MAIIVNKLKWNLITKLVFKSNLELGTRPQQNPLNLDCDKRKRNNLRESCMYEIKTFLGRNFQLRTPMSKTKHLPSDFQD